MKRLLCAQLILLLLNCSLKSQWYTKQYGVNDIRDLTNEQLTISFQDYKKVTIAGGCSIGLGCLSILVANTTYKNGLPEDATFGEEILGSRVMKGIYKILGYGLIGGGVIACNIGISRSHNIKKVMIEHNKYNNSISFRPVFINNNGPLCTGLTISYRF